MATIYQRCIQYAQTQEEAEEIKLEIKATIPFKEEENGDDVTAEGEEGEMIDPYSVYIKTLVKAYLFQKYEINGRQKVILGILLKSLINYGMTTFLSFSFLRETGILRRVQG